MIQKIRSWLVRKRDRTTVSYNRFGRQGEDHEDKAPPSIIHVAPFEENAREFMLFNICHVTKAAVYFASFGLSMVILSFITTFFEFDWYHHRKGVDVTALLILFLYMAVGVFIHYYVIYGVKRQKARYLLPFIAIYSIICTFEIFTCFALLFKTIDPNATMTAVAASGITVQNPPYFLVMVGVLIILCVQGIMLISVLRCRYFLSQKELHEMALKVAEKSRTEYPSIQIVIARFGATDATSMSDTFGGHPFPSSLNGTRSGDEINTSSRTTPKSSTEQLGNHQQGNGKVSQIDSGEEAVNQMNEMPIVKRII